MNTQRPNKKQKSDSKDSKEIPDKTQDDRITECVQLRQQLQQLGALMSDVNRVKVTDAFNAFVQEGVPCQLRLALYESSYVCVSLKKGAGKRSGITLEQPQR